MDPNMIVDPISDNVHEVLILAPPIRASVYLHGSGYVEVGQVWAPGNLREDAEPLIRLAMSDFISAMATGADEQADRKAGGDPHFLRRLGACR